jgi:PKD repeat protein
MGSIAINDSHEIAMGYSISSSSMSPNIRYCGQSASGNASATGLMDIAESADMVSSAQSQGTGSYHNRWGDYSLMTVDPTDGITCWYTDEYYNSGKKTRILSFTIGSSVLTAQFSGTPTSVDVGNSVTFTDASYGPNPITSWNWNFPGGTPSSYSGQNPPPVTYNTVGTYDVTLTVGDGSSTDVETKTNYINVINCTVSSYPWTEGFENGGNIPDCWSNEYVTDTQDWAYQAGGHSGNPSGAHTGSYNACLYNSSTTANVTKLVTPQLDMSGLSSATLTFWHTQAFWSPDQDELRVFYKTSAGGSWTLLATYTNDITSWTQETINLTSLSNDYYIAFEGTAQYGYGVCVDDVNVDGVAGGSPPVADFSADDVTPAVGQTVTFTDLSSDSPTSWSWSFSPATITYVGGTSSSSQNPQVTFDATGTYSVTLTATNAYGSDMETKANYILSGTAGNWTGIVSTDWNTGDNWETLIVPTSSDNVTIPASAPNWPTFTGNFALGTDCKNMTMEGASVFTCTGDLSISSGKTLTCNGSNEIFVAGDWNNNGDFIPGNSKVFLYGNTNTVISASSVVNNSLQTTFAGGNGSNGNMFDIVAINEVTVTSFDGNLDAGNGDVHIYYKTGTYVGFETNQAAWTFVGTTSVTSSGSGSATSIPIPVNITIPAGQTYAFYIHAENGNDYTNGSGAGNIYVSDANIQILEGCGKGNPLFTGDTYSPRVFNGIVHYSYAGGSSNITYNYLVIDKINAEVNNLSDLNVNGDFTINPNAYFTNGAGNTLNVSGNTVFKSDASGMASFIDNGTSTFVNSVKVQVYLTDGRWHFIGMPVSSAVAGVFHLPSGHSDIYLRTHIEASNTWDNWIVPVTTPLLLGRGYETWVGTPGGFSQPETIEFEGALNTGDYTTGAGGFYGLQYTTGHGLNMISNPYPSALEADIDTWSKSNIDNSVWIWSDSDGNYVYWNGTDSTNSNGWGTMTGGVIPEMQGFFVLANGANPSLTIPQSGRIHSSQAYYKDSYVPENTLRLEVTGNDYKDVAFVSFNESATGEYDNNLDVQKLFGLDEAPQLYSVIPNKLLSINSLPELTESKVVQLGFECGVNGQFTFTAGDIESFTDYTPIYLEDTKEGIIRKLNDNPVYTFTHSPLDDNNRFILHFGEVNGVGDISTGGVNVYSNKNTVYVMKPADFNGIVFIYDMLGQEIIIQKATGEGLMSIPVTNGTGYYVVKVQSDEKLVTRKVLIY